MTATLICAEQARRALQAAYPHTPYLHVLPDYDDELGLTYEALGLADDPCKNTAVFAATDTDIADVLGGYAQLEALMLDLAERNDLRRTVFDLRHTL